MKKIILLVFTQSIAFLSIAQKDKIDSLQKLLKVEQKDSSKVKLLWNLAQEYQVYKPDTSLILAQQAFQLAKKIKYIEGESRSLNQIANAFNRVGNYAKALKFYLEKLKIEEQRNSPENLAIAYMNIATVYLLQEEHKRAIGYALIADSIIVSHNIERLKLYSLLNMSDMYEKDNKLDSALELATKAYWMAIKTDDYDLLGSTLNNLGNICSKIGNTKLAIDNYRKGLPFLEMSNDEDVICETSIGLARTFLKIGQLDSAEFYARKSYNLSLADGFLGRNLDASIFLKELFKSKSKIDSAYVYQEHMISIKDSIYSSERIKESQIISLDEQLRQKEISDLRMQENEERNKRLQLLAIGIALPALILFTIYLSKKKIRPRLVETLGVISLLLVFEYITLLLHPQVSAFTHHIPVFELIIFAVIAAILTRVHHRIEHYMMTRLTHKHLHPH